MKSKDAASQRPYSRPRRWTGPLVMVALVVVGSVAISSALARVQGSDSVADTDGLTTDSADVLQSEIDNMVAGGTPANHPKVQRLREDLAVLRDGAKSTPPGEPGLDLSPTLGARRGGGARAMTGGRDETVAWDQGAVECEPIPPDELTAAEVAGASCASAPQPDGTNRYVAVSPDGTVRVVRFTTDGNVTREPDIRIDVFGALLQGIELAVDLLGDVVVSVTGSNSPVATIDLG